MNIAPSLENYDSIIFSATLTMEAEGILFADVAGWDKDGPHKNEATWINARRLKWRDASDWMGAAMRYGPER